MHLTSAQMDRAIVAAASTHLADYYACTEEEQANQRKGTAYWLMPLLEVLPAHATAGNVEIFMPLVQAVVEQGMINRLQQTMMFHGQAEAVIRDHLNPEAVELFTYHLAAMARTALEAIQPQDEALLAMLADASAWDLDEELKNLTLPPS